MTAQIHGFCDNRFGPLKEAFAANFDAGLELGASLGVTWRGNSVVDLWAGFSDVEETRPWERDTIVLVASTTKIAVALSALMLIDRGLIDVDAPVARYWPEFAAGGKASVTVRDALTHRAGVPGLDPPVAFSTLNDWNAITERIAAEPHWFEGRRVICYHASTFGFIVGEIVRRVDGRGPARFFREEIAQKIGADFQIGLGAMADLRRVARVRDLHPPERPEGLAERVMNTVGPGEWDWARLSADIPGGNGFTNGRSLARLCAIVAMRGELDGVRYLSQAMIDQIATEQVFEEDFLFGPLRFGLGFGLSSKDYWTGSATGIHWGGYGGSFGLMDPASEVSLGYAPNNFTTDVHDGTVHVDARLQRFIAALEKIMADSPVAA